MYLFKELNWFKALWNWRRNAREITAPDPHYRVPDMSGFLNAATPECGQFLTRCAYDQFNPHTSSCENCGQLIGDHFKAHRAESSRMKAMG